MIFMRMVPSENQSNQLPKISGLPNCSCRLAPKTFGAGGARYLSATLCGLPPISFSCVLTRCRPEVRASICFCCSATRNWKLFRCSATAVKLGNDRALLLDLLCLLLHFLVFLEKLVEQHGIDRFVTHAVRLALLVADNQVGIHLLHFLGNQPKLRHSVRVVLVVKRHRPQRQNRFTAFAHVGNVLLKST